MTWQAFRRRLAEVFARDRVAREAEEELQEHVEQAVAARMESGMSEQEARRRVNLEAGRVDPARDRLAEERTGIALERSWREVGHAARVLRACG